MIAAARDLTCQGAKVQRICEQRKQKTTSTNVRRWLKVAQIFSPCVAHATRVAAGDMPARPLGVNAVSPGQHLHLMTCVALVALGSSMSPPSFHL